MIFGLSLALHLRSHSYLTSTSSCLPSLSPFVFNNSMHFTFFKLLNILTFSVPAAYFFYDLVFIAMLPSTTVSQPILISYRPVCYYKTRNKISYSLECASRIVRNLSNRTRKSAKLPGEENLGNTYRSVAVTEA
jgi:hypothetical protein